MEGQSGWEQAIQCLLAMQQQETQALTNIAAEQREDRALLREWIQRPATPPPEPGTSSRRPPAVSLQRMTPEDDTEAYLDLFEGTAEACGWPEEERAVRLLPLLTGAAQLAAHSLPASSRQDYQRLRKAILDRLGCTPEGHRRRFRDLTFGEAGRPFSYAQQLPALSSSVPQTSRSPCGYFQLVFALIRVAK